MGKLIASMFVTLDGYTAGPNGEMEWFTDAADPEVDGHMTGVLRGVDAILLGRVTYELLGSYWPTAEGQATGPDAENARLLNTIPKVVVSTTPVPLDWMPATRIGGDVADGVAELKRRTGRDVVVFGGARTVQSLMELDLVDQYHLAVHPVLLGAGQSLFGASDRQRDLRLVDVTAFEKSGAVILHYQA
ncbi:dihydrofolate reductase family protein [Allosalinactinospora lopnorensis]|uniref:dihydrofolate reductase family protein n=1 Tax=Allosalinactinospora lopnorensis TaxID=1352348 RepID=UPI000623C72A|nr:dihydrofolate reductase family protein [Allosalinactinospora lopnorensis]